MRHLNSQMEAIVFDPFKYPYLAIFLVWFMWLLFDVAAPVAVAFTTIYVLLHLVGMPW